MNTTQHTAHVNGVTAHGTPHFDAYVCSGDTVSVEDGLYTYTARIERDDDSRPEDWDCYDKDAIDAWRNNEWWFCDIVISAAYNDIELPDDYLASLGSIEANFPGSDNKYLAEVVDELLPEAKERAQALVEEMRAKLAA